MYNKPGWGEVHTLVGLAAFVDNFEWLGEDLALTGDALELTGDGSKSGNGKSGKKE